MSALHTSRVARRPLLPRNVRRALRTFSISLMAAGIVLLADAGLTLVWQEPISAVYAHFKQQSLASALTSSTSRRGSAFGI